MKLMIVATLFLLPCVALAQVKPPDAAPSAPKLPTEAEKTSVCDQTRCTLDLNMVDINSLFCGLVELDGRPDAAQETDPRGGGSKSTYCQSDAHRTPYALGALVVTIARDMSALQDVAKHVSDAQTKIQKQFDQFVDPKADPKTVAVGCGGRKLTPDKLLDCAEKLQELADAKNPVVLFPLSAKKLDFDHNNFPGTVTSAILPLLTDAP